MDYEMDIDLGPGPEADLDRQPTQTVTYINCIKLLELRANLT